MATPRLREGRGVIGPALHSPRQQTAVKEVTRPLLSLVEQGACDRAKLVLYGQMIGQK